MEERLQVKDDNGVLRVTIDNSYPYLQEVETHSIEEAKYKGIEVQQAVPDSIKMQKFVRETIKQERPEKLWEDSAYTKNAVKDLSENQTNMVVLMQQFDGNMKEIMKRLLWISEYIKRQK